MKFWHHSKAAKQEGVVTVRLTPENQSVIYTALGRYLLECRRLANSAKVNEDYDFYLQEEQLVSRMHYEFKNLTQ